MAMLAVIKGAGDIATGVALRLKRAGFQVAMTDLPWPTAIRRTVAFSEAIFQGETKVEDCLARRADSVPAAVALLENGVIPVLPDPEGKCVPALRPAVLVDAILAKRNLGTALTDAPAVIGVGPGFTAGVDCHAVVETQRGHYLGRVIWRGSAAANTGVPGNIGGYTVERVLRAPCDGVFRPMLKIGDQVHAGEIAAWVGEAPMLCTIDGILRGILPDGTQVSAGMKSGDIDPRCARSHCFCASDKSLSVGGGVLEAALALTGALRGK